MATKSVRFKCYTGLTLTASYFPDGSDTAVATGLACTESTNRKGLYTFSSSHAITAGRHLVLVYEGSDLIAMRWVYLTDTAETFTCYNEPLLLSVSGRPEANTTHAAGTAWGSGAITSGVFASGAINAAAIASGAITSSKFGAGAITNSVLASGAISASTFAASAITSTVLHSNASSAIASSVWSTSVSAPSAQSMKAFLGPVRSGFAQSGSSTTITLDASATATNDIYKGLLVSIIDGTGIEQGPRLIIAYNGTTKVATVSPDWTVAPDSSSVFALHRTGSVLLADVAHEGTVPADLVSVGGDQQSATDLKDLVDTGYDPATHKIAGVVLVDTTDVLTGHTPQTGDAYPLLSDGTYGLNALQNLLDTIVLYVDELETRLSATRAGYLDKLNITGNVASQADVQALNQSAARRVVLATVQQYEIPSTGDVEYELELRTYDADGAAAAADSTPTLTATGILSGDLSANLSAATNPATGVYRWIYTASASDTLEQLRFDASATIGGSTFTIATYAQVCDFVAATWTLTDQSNLNAIYNKLPSKGFLAGTDNTDGDIQMDEATGNFAGSVGSVAGNLGGDVLGGVAGSVGSIAGVTFPVNFELLAISAAGHVVLQDASLTTAKLGTFVLAKTTNITGFNDVSTAQVGGEVDASLADVGLTTTITGRIDQPISSRSSHTAGDVWGVADRQLTAFNFNVTVGDYAADKSPSDFGLSTFNPDSQNVTVGGYATGQSPADLVASPAAIAAALLDLANAVESGVTVRNVLRLLAATLGGLTSGAGTGTERFRNINNTKDVIVATVDGDGNRTDITRDLT